MPLAVFISSAARVFKFNIIQMISIKEHQQGCLDGINVHVINKKKNHQTNDNLSIKLLSKNITELNNFLAISSHYPYIP